MEAHKLEYQIRCSHYEIEFDATDRKIVCSICGKVWIFKGQRGYSKPKDVYAADKES